MPAAVMQTKRAHRLNENSGGSSSPSLASFGRAQSLSGLTSSNNNTAHSYQQQLYSVGVGAAAEASVGPVIGEGFGSDLLLSPQQHIERLDAESLAALSLYLTILCLMVEILLEMHCVDLVEDLLADALAESTFAIYIRQHYLFKYIVRALVLQLVLVHFHRIQFSRQLGFSTLLDLSCTSR